MDRDLEFREFALGQSAGLRHLAYALSGDWHRADDLVQATLERAYVRWATVRVADDPGSNVRSTLINLSASQGRRRWRRREHSAQAVPQIAEPVDGAERIGRGVDLGRALTELTSMQRAVVVLCFVEDRPVQEAALILGSTEGTVKRQLHDAVQLLRRFMLDADTPPREARHA